MADKDLPSNSDESDEDFVPEENVSSGDSGSGNSGEEEDDSGEETGPKSKKRRKVSKRKKKKKGNEDECEDDEENKDKAEKVTDVDALWADFKEDVNKMEKQIVSSEEKEKSIIKKQENPQSSNAETVKEEQCDDKSNSFKASLENKRKPIPSGLNNSKLGLSKILNQIGKKDKMSTLAKSKLDWNNFKKSEGIEDEIKTFNKGKDGYLEKQDFLQRTDLRQFEIEKQLRATRRKF